MSKEVNGSSSCSPWHLDLPIVYSPPYPSLNHSSLISDEAPSPIELSSVECLHVEPLGFTM